MDFPKEFVRISAHCGTCHSLTADRQAQRRRDRVKAISRTPAGRARRLVSAARARAKAKDIPFDLDVSDIQSRIERGLCEASGLPFDLGPAPTGYTSNPWSPSLDRKDPRLGYVYDNVQVVVTIFNVAKGQWHFVDVLALAMALTKS